MEVSLQLQGLKAQSTYSSYLAHSPKMPEMEIVRVMTPKIQHTSPENLPWAGFWKRFHSGKILTQGKLNGVGVSHLISLTAEPFDYQPLRGSSALPKLLRHSWRIRFLFFAVRLNRRTCFSCKGKNHLRFATRK